MFIVTRLLGVSRMLCVALLFFWMICTSLVLSLQSYLGPINTVLGSKKPLSVGNAFLNFVTSRIMVLGGIDVDIKGYKGERDGVIYMYNHTSNLDPLLVRLIGGNSHFLYKKELQKVPVMGWNLRAYQHIVVDRNNKEKSLEAVNEVSYNYLKEGGSITIAPEGTRSRDGALLPFKKGGFHLAVQAQAPIVPVMLTGVSPLLPKHSAMIVPGRVRIEILPDIVPRKGETVDQLLERTHAAFAKYKTPTLAPFNAIVAAIPSVMFWFIILGGLLARLTGKI